MLIIFVVGIDDVGGAADDVVHLVSRGLVRGPARRFFPSGTSSPFFQPASHSNEITHEWIFSLSLFPFFRFRKIGFAQVGSVSTAAAKCIRIRYGVHRLTPNSIIRFVCGKFHFGSKLSCVLFAHWTARLPASMLHGFLSGGPACRKVRFSLKRRTPFSITFVITTQTLSLDSLSRRTSVKSRCARTLGNWNRTVCSKMNQGSC